MRVNLAQPKEHAKDSDNSSGYLMQRCARKLVGSPRELVFLVLKLQLEGESIFRCPWWKEDSVWIEDLFRILSRIWDLGSEVMFHSLDKTSTFLSSFMRERLFRSD